MIAAFQLERPTWIAAALVAVVAAALWLRANRLRRIRGGAVASSRATHRRVGSLLRTCIALAVALLLTLWLMLASTALAHVVLALAVMACGTWLAVEAYRNRPPGVTRLRAGASGLFRSIAWVALVVLLARPAWDWRVVEWEAPLLVVLLDDSRSMQTVDPPLASGERHTRTERVAAALADASEAVRTLERNYDVRTRRLTAPAGTSADLQLKDDAPISPVGAALQDCAQLRSSALEPPRLVLLISDGADNVGGSDAVRAAADALRKQAIGLVAVGVGPPEGRTPLVELQPLGLPARIGLRERLRVTVAGRVQACTEQPLRVEMLWGNGDAASRTVRARKDDARLNEDFELVPPAPGPQRVTARVTLPERLGGSVFETSTVVDVEEGRIRVLLVEGPPRSEAAFVSRALAGDPRLELTRRFFLEQTSDLDSEMITGEAAWSEFDVVVLGNVPKWRLTSGTLRALAEAVTQRGVGLFLAGGPDFFNSGSYANTVIADIAPIGFVNRGRVDDVRAGVAATETGRRHPILAGLGAPEPRGGAAGRADSRPDRPGGDPAATEGIAWEQLPALGGMATFGEPRTLATVLLRNTRSEAVLVTQDVERGRVAAAAWESTWPWALASDAGAALFERFWRQAVVWLANRRPRAWVLTDQTSYALAALRARQQVVGVHAGIAGIAAAEVEQMQGVRAWLEVRHATAGDDSASRPVGEASPTVRIPLRREGSDWFAELSPGSEAGEALLTSGGDYVAEAVFEGLDPTVVEPDVAGSATSMLRGRTGFEITVRDLEAQAPNSDLATMRAAAKTTEEVGGRYLPVEALPAVLGEIAGQDRRSRRERQLHYGLVGRNPWLLLAAFVTALAIEWGLRKRAGMP